MFKSRRPALRRCRENHRFGVRSREKRPNLEGISNITSNRVTIPPEFFSLRGKPKAPQNSRGKEDHSPNPVFNENRNRLRRSARISRKSDDSENLTLSEYYNKVLKGRESDQPKATPVGDSYTTRGIKRNNSKSLFREINDRCAKVEGRGFDYPIRAVLDPHSKVERFYPSAFCFDLSREVSLDIRQHDYVLDSKLTVAERIRDINEQLQGKTDSRKGIFKRDEKMESKDQQDDFRYVPRSEWVYRTPPRQRLAPPRVEECAIQPAVICTAKKRSNIYELTGTVDLTGFSNRQNVPVDGRYMRRVASFGGDLEVAGCSFLKYRDRQNPVSPFFGNVVARPIKTVKKASRTDKFYARKSDGDLDFTPTGLNLFQSLEEFERDVTFVEDNGKFKMVDAAGATGGKKFEFKFRRSLFKGSDEKMFNFDPEESKMFNFSNLKRN